MLWAPAEPSAILLLHVFPSPAEVRVEGASEPYRVFHSGLWVEVEPRQAVKLDVSLPYHHPLTVVEQAPPAGTRHVYVRLQLERPLVQPKTRPRNSDTLFFFTPWDAHLVIDGEPVGRGRAPVRVPLSPGPHWFSLTARGWRGVRHDIEIPEGGGDVVVNLEPGGDTLVEITSRPAGAEVYIDQWPVGRTPIQGLRLAPNERYRMIVRKDGYYELLRWLQPSDEPEYSLHLDLRLKPPGISREYPQDVEVSVIQVGDAARGRRLLTRCNACHGHEAPPIDLNRLAPMQWTLFWASSQHGQWAPLRGRFTVDELADIRTYCVETSARNTARLYLIR